MTINSFVMTWQNDCSVSEFKALVPNLGVNYRNWCDGHCSVVFDFSGDLREATDDGNVFLFV